MGLFIEDGFCRLQQRKGMWMFVGALGEISFFLEIIYASLYNASGRTERKKPFPA